MRRKILAALLVMTLVISAFTANVAFTADNPQLIVDLGTDTGPLRAGTWTKGVWRS